MKEQLLSFFYRYKSFGKELTVNSFYRGLTAILVFISGVIFSRDLLEANRGQYQLFINSLLIFYMFLNFGLFTSASYYAKKTPEKMKQYLGLNAIINVFSTFVIFVLLFSFTDYFKFQSTSLRNLFFITYLCYSFHMIFRSFLVGVGEYTYLQKIGFYLKILFTLSIVILHFQNHITVFNVCLLFACEYFIFSIICYKKLGLNFLPFSFDKQFIIESFFFNIKAYIVTILWTLIMRGDQYIIKYFMGNFHVGLYSIGATIVENIGLINGIFVGMIVPRFVGETDYLKKLGQTKKGLLFVSALSVVLAIIIYIMSPYIVELFFKKFNHNATQSLRVLMIGFIFWSLYQVLSVVYLSQRIKKTQILILTFCTIISFVLNYLYIPKYGIEASAWISTLCYFMMFIGAYIDLFYLKKKNWVSKHEYEK